MKVLKKGWKDLFPKVNRLWSIARAQGRYGCAQTIEAVMNEMEEEPIYIEAFGEDPPKFKGYAGGGAFSTMPQAVADGIDHYYGVERIAREKKMTNEKGQQGYVDKVYANLELKRYLARLVRHSDARGGSFSEDISLIRDTILSYQAAKKWYPAEAVGERDT